MSTETERVAIESESAKPRRRVELTLELGADSWREAADMLHHLSIEIERGHMRGRSISGGYSAGYVYDASEDESVTHDSYFAALDEYLDATSTDEQP